VSSPTNPKPPQLRILSLGAGVQSSAVLLMACEGELPGLDAAIFADTGWEPPEVYEHLEHVLMPRAKTAGIPLIVTRKYEDGRDVRSRPWEMPLFITNSEGEAGMIRRQCTSRFKITPVRKVIRELLGDVRLETEMVEQWFGISFDEMQRMRDSDARFIRHHYPLVDLRMSRADCSAWLARHDVDAPRSACIGCPFHSDAEWLAIKRKPAQWAEAVAVDAALRGPDRIRDGALKDFTGEAFLHPSRIPLADVTLRHENQLTMFGDECAGVCGV
jgi:hypothetical protein